MNVEDIDRYEEWKKNNPNGSTNEYYNFSKNKEAVIPSIDNLGLKEKESFSIGPMTKLFIACMVIIAIFKYEYIGEKISQARTFILEKTNMGEDPDGFNETSFDSREAEIAYIREYVRYKFITQEREKFDNSKNGLREYASLMLEIFIAPKIEEIMSEVVRQDLNITQAKEKVRGILKEIAEKEAVSETQDRAKEKSQEEYLKKAREKEAAKYEDNQADIHEEDFHEEDYEEVSLDSVAGQH